MKGKSGQKDEGELNADESNMEKWDEAEQIGKCNLGRPETKAE
jgi:hypothetical protein